MALQIDLMARALKEAETWAFDMRDQSISTIEMAKTWNVDVETYLRVQSLHEAVQPIFHPVEHWRITTRNIVPAQAVVCACFWVGTQIVVDEETAKVYMKRLEARLVRLRREYGPDIFNFGHFTTVFYPAMIEATAESRERLDQLLNPLSPTPKWAAWRCILDAGLQYLGYDERPITVADIAFARRHRMAKRR